jgi:GDPmannose 4,6-dehydratase
MSTSAIITGITGQDGAYLSRLLLKKGYKVIGLVRNSSKPSLRGLHYLGIEKEVQIAECDLSDIGQITKILHTFKPTEIYNLAAQSSVSLSFQRPIGTLHFNIISVLNLLESIRLVNPAIRFYQASSSEMYGKVAQLPIVEQTAIHPLSPYAISKAAAHWTIVNYREAYQLYTCAGILFNHESYLRSENFFVKKIIRESINIHKGKVETLEVGNIEIRRDFGFAPKYVEAMWLMLQQEQPDDYLICSGESVLLRDIILHVFKRLNISEERITINPKFLRPTDIQDIYGIPYKAKVKLDWNYNMSFFEVLDILLEEELKNYVEGKN